MQPNPKISIITCFLNVELFLEEAVASVLQQTYTNWELMLIDDGSSDGSTALAKKFAAQHHGKIIYCEHPGHINKGSSASRNLGIQKATGELIAFLDADDVLLPEYLATQVQTMQQHSVPMICEATFYWRSWQNNPVGDVVLPVGAPPNRVYNPPQLLLELYPLGKGAAPCICGIVLEKKLLLQHGSFNEEFTGMYDEQIPLSKLYLHERIYISDTCNNYYRQRSDSLVGTSKQNRKAYLQVRKRYLEWLESYLQQIGYSDPRVTGLLQRAFIPYRRPVVHLFVNTLPQNIVRARRKIENLLHKLAPAPH